MQTRNIIVGAWTRLGWRFPPDLSCRKSSCVPCTTPFLYTYSEGVSKAFHFVFQPLKKDLSRQVWVRGLLLNGKKRGTIVIASICFCIWGRKGCATIGLFSTVGPCLPAGHRRPAGRQGWKNEVSLCEFLVIHQAVRFSAQLRPEVRMGHRDQVFHPLFYRALAQPCDAVFCNHIVRQVAGYGHDVVE